MEIVEGKQDKSRIYVELFGVDEICCMAAEDVVEYSKSYARRLDDQAALEYAKQEAAKEGRAEGRAEGLVEGIAEGILRTARNLLKAGVSPEIIYKTTGLTLDQLNAC